MVKRKFSVAVFLALALSTGCATDSTDRGSLVAVPIRGEEAGIEGVYTLVEKDEKVYMLTTVYMPQKYTLTNSEYDTQELDALLREPLAEEEISEDSVNLRVAFQRKEASSSHSLRTTCAVNVSPDELDAIAEAEPMIVLHCCDLNGNPVIVELSYVSDDAVSEGK